MLLNGYVVCKVMESYKKKTALKDKIGLNCWVLIEKRKRCGFRRKTPASSVHTLPECYQSELSESVGAQHAQIWIDYRAL